MSDYQGLVKKRSWKRIFLMILATSLLVGGLWFTTTNAFKFGKAMLIFEIQQSQELKASAAPRSRIGSLQEDKLIPVAKTESENPILLESDLSESEVESSITDSEPILTEENWVPEIGELMGVLEIPAITASLPIYHGTDEDELEKGVGHYADSVLPGYKDNSVLSGHRDTVFRKLGEVGEKDILVVKTKSGEYTYRVFNVRIVDADDRTVIVPSGKAKLTVTTCYPFQFIGNAPERYVLEAYLIDEKSYSNGDKVVFNNK
ncbi:class D sortase [Salipaludibacillus sp. CF4.18]|uniref:class D sortase n=1 Tax=Salipaludibacillus sp. CF4.18 TaxID=3373081 RepID=UPI003EE4BD95